MTAVTSAGIDDWLLDPVLAPAIAGDAIQPYYDAAARAELSLPFCARCGVALELEQLVCDGCGTTERQWRPTEREGVVHAATMMHRGEPGLVRAGVPYPIVDVELRSGHRIVMTTATPSGSAPAIGTAVRIGFRRLGDVTLPAIDILEVTE